MRGKKSLVPVAVFTAAIVVLAYACWTRAIELLNARSDRAVFGGILIVVAMIVFIAISAYILVSRLLQKP